MDQNRKNKSNHNCPVWCVLGDFKLVRSEHERRGITRNLSQKIETTKSNEFIERCELFDIPVVGTKYTWYCPNGLAKSRLILVSEAWLQHWHDSNQYILNRQVFDHCAVMVKNNTIDLGPKPFKTFDLWQ